MSKEKDVLITPEAAAERLSVSANTIRSWLRDGTLPGVKIGKGRIWRIKEKDLEEFIDGDD